MDSVISSGQKFTAWRLLLGNGFPWTLEAKMQKAGIGIKAKPSVRGLWDGVVLLYRLTGQDVPSEGDTALEKQAESL